MWQRQSGGIQQCASTCSVIMSLVLQIVSVAQAVPTFRYDPNTSKKRNPNRRRRWLIPLFIIAQVALKVSVLHIVACILKADTSILHKKCIVAQPCAVLTRLCYSIATSCKRHAVNNLTNCCCRSMSLTVSWKMTV